MPRAVIASPSDATSAPGVAPRAAVSLVGAAEFDRCLACRPLWRDGAFALHLLRHRSVEPVAGAGPDAAPSVAAPVWRLGLVIPKRYEASAVARNTIKRRWRAAFRAGRDAWAGEFGSADLVVRMQAPLVPKAERPAMPAKLRARRRFDPQAALASLIERLRRGGAAVRASA